MITDDAGAAAEQNAGRAEFVRAGGCQCGGVRYRITAPALEVNHCHCSICRKVHGALFASFARVRKSNFILERPSEADLGVFRSSAVVQRHFCTRCGSPLFITIYGYPDRVWLAAGTLDSGAHPGHPADNEIHIFVGSKSPWFPIADGLPQHERY